MNRTDEQNESLGAFLSRVRPGDKCACCGATLQASSPPTDEARPACGTSRVRLTVVVVCPACGCEISEEAGPDAEAAWVELSPAA